MGKLEKIVADIKALPASIQEETIEAVEALIAERQRPASALSEVQIAELKRRLADPGPDLTDAEVDQLFEELTRA